MHTLAASRTAKFGILAMMNCLACVPKSLSDRFRHGYRAQGSVICIAECGVVAVTFHQRVSCQSEGLEFWAPVRYAVDVRPCRQEIGR